MLRIPYKTGNSHGQQLKMLTRLYYLRISFSVGIRRHKVIFEQAEVHMRIAQTLGKTEDRTAPHSFYAQKQMLLRYRANNYIIVRLILFN